MVKVDLTKLVISLALSVLAAVVGSIPVMLSGGVAWQDTLNKPFFAPPDWLFGPAWTVLFLLMAIAFYLIWLKWPEKEAKTAMALYIVQLFLNVTWNYLFFGMRRPDLAMIGIVVLLAMIAITTLRFYGIDRRAGYLMVPYLLWVAFATCLNIAIWMLNPVVVT